MKRIQLALHIKGLDPGGTELYANDIYQALTNNTNFTGAAPLLPMLGTGIGDLRNALISGQPNGIAIKNRVTYVVKVLNAIKGIVELECGDDAEKALTSGFALKQQGAAVKPKTFGAVQGSVSGTVDLVCPTAGTRAAYVWEVTTDLSVAADWRQFKITNTTGTQIGGLNPGMKYWFRVKAIVHDVEQPYTDPHLVHVV